MESIRRVICGTFCPASQNTRSTASKNFSPGMSRPKLLHTHSTLLDRADLMSRRPRDDAYLSRQLETSQNKRLRSYDNVAVALKPGHLLGKQAHSVRAIGSIPEIRNQTECKTSLSEL